VTTVQKLSRGRLRLRQPDEAESLVAVAAPDGRAAWRAALDEVVSRGADGIVVPASPRLLDILRNPDDAGERLDLHLATG
jgi:hypothetical protein